jgi:hypothetical protein
MLTCLRFLDFGLHQLDENSHTNSGGDAMGDGPDECITHPSGHNQMTTEGQSFYIYFAILCIASFVWWMHSYCVQFLDGSTHHDDNVMGDDNIMGDDNVTSDGPCCITHACGHNRLTKQGESLFG